jgi:hypothetical protein
MKGAASKLAVKTGLCRVACWIVWANTRDVMARYRNPRATDMKVLGEALDFIKRWGDQKQKEEFLATKLKMLTNPGRAGTIDHGTSRVGR